MRVQEFMTAISQQRIHADNLTAFCRKQSSADTRVPFGALESIQPFPQLLRVSLTPPKTNLGRMKVPRASRLAVPLL